MKEIQGFPGYFVSKDGNIYSKKKGYITRLKPFSGSSNYLCIGIISKDGIRYKRLVHRLVAITYIDNPNNLPEVNHKNKNIFDNAVENLEWVTRRENLEQSYETMSPVRNYRECFLLQNSQLVGAFKSISRAGDFAETNLGVSGSMIKRHLQHKDVEIIKIKQ